MDDMSGDGVAGGAFMTGFTVVPYGNIVYARPDYVENPLLPSTLSNGSLANPYPVLAPEGNPATAPANPTHNPNGGLNIHDLLQPVELQTGVRLQRRRQVRAVRVLRGVAIGVQRPGRDRRPARPPVPQPDRPAP